MEKAIRREDSEIRAIQKAKDLRTSSAIDGLETLLHCEMAKRREKRQTKIN